MPKSAMTLVTALVFTGFAFASNPRAVPLEQWLSEAHPVALKNLVRNINPPGTQPGVVVASPSRENPDYFYHWVRDAALVMQIIVDNYQYAKTPEERGKALSSILDFMDFSLKNQATPGLIGGIGEPKFNVDGSAYNEPWGRPQDDGPALRALVMTRFSLLLIAEGSVDLVSSRLFAKGSRVATLIKTDLDYVATHWKNTSYDLWEEVKGHHFFTRMVQRKSLIEGAKLALLMGDPASAERYQAQVAPLEAQLHRHWDEARGYLVNTLDRDEGIPYKVSNLDAAIVLGVLHGATDDGFFSVADPKVQATVLKMKEAFRKLYPINHGGPQGVAIGRYPEDRYDGYGTNGEGNPWILLTNAFAEYCYKLGRHYETLGRIEGANVAFFKDLGIRIGSRQILLKGTPEFSRATQRIFSAGDEYFARTQYHADSDGQLSEQMNRWSGFMQGARDLTWSYASFLTALAARR